MTEQISSPQHYHHHNGTATTALRAGLFHIPSFVSLPMLVTITNTFLRQERSGVGFEPSQAFDTSRKNSAFPATLIYNCGPDRQADLAWENFGQTTSPCSGEA